jgi:hypothetical protein
VARKRVADKEGYLGLRKTQCSASSDALGKFKGEDMPNWAALKAAG